MKIKVNTVTCMNCKDEIYSRARHDYHSCSCGKTTVDGGFDYLKYGWGTDKAPTVGSAMVEATEHSLFQDWNLSKDAYGTISRKEAASTDKKRLKTTVALVTRTKGRTKKGV